MKQVGTLINFQLWFYKNASLNLGTGKAYNNYVSTMLNKDIKSSPKR
jgi:hypothetical protein